MNVEWHTMVANLPHEGRYLFCYDCDHALSAYGKTAHKLEEHLLFPDEKDIRAWHHDTAKDVYLFRFKQGSILRIHGSWDVQGFMPTKAEFV